MRRFRKFSLLRWISLAMIASSVLLLVFQLVVYSRLRSSFSPGSVIAGVDVSGLDVDGAADRLTQAYSVPVELYYGDSSFQVKPSSLGFSLDLSTMMAAADQARASLPFWSAFWDYLFNQMPASQEIPIKAQIDVNQMRAYLVNEVAARYDLDPEPYLPVSGDAFFTAGKAGISLDVDRSMELITMALKSPSDRSVNLSLKKSASARPSMENLQALLAEIIDANKFEGVTEIYMLDLQTGQDMQMAYQNGEMLIPDIAFSASSTIKIPIMIEVFRRKSEPIDEETFSLLEKMITLSDNDAADALMNSVIEENLGPLRVTETIEDLGLKNTFLTGMFYNGAPNLRIIHSTAYNRTDVFLDPDPYNQTTPTEIGSLLNDIYQCSQTNGGSLIAVFPGQITQNECRMMISLLANNRIAMLLEAGLPDGTQIAHKHGYDRDINYITHMIGDAAIIYSPGGNYILSVYIHDFNQIVFEKGNQLLADISRAVYNYFNLSSQ